MIAKVHFIALEIVALEYVQGIKIICSFTLNKFNNAQL